MALLLWLALAALTSTKASTHTRSNKTAAELLHSMHFAIPKEWNYEGAQSWTNAIIIRKYKLMVCTITKVASTEWRKMLRRLDGQEHVYRNPCPHHQDTNGLTYIDKIPLEELRKMSMDPSWTKVVFVRNPLSRILAGYLDKLVADKNYFRRPVSHKMNEKTISIHKFLSLIKNTRHDVDCDEHWRRQSAFCGLRFIPYDFVGHFENIQEDSKLLLRKLGLWEQYGQSGWGRNGTQPFLSPDDKHTAADGVLTNATDKVFQEFTPLTAKMLTDYYMEDFLRFGYPTDTYKGVSLTDPNNFVARRGVNRRRLRSELPTWT